MRENSLSAFALALDMENDLENMEIVTTWPSWPMPDAKSLHVELSFTRTTKEAPVFEPAKKSKRPQYPGWINTGSKLAHIPLAVCSQLLCGTTLPQTVVTPCKEDKVFCSRYGNAEFTFSHYEQREFVPTQLVIVSKTHSVQGGIPVGQGLIFMSDSLADL